MAGEWKIVRLCEVASTRNGAGIKQDAFSETGIPLARVSDFTDWSIDMSACIRVDFEAARRWENHRLKEGEAIIATVGSWPPNWSSVVGKAVRVPRSAVGAIQNQNTCCVLERPAISDQRFLFYLLRSESFAHYAANSAAGRANEARLPVANLERFEFPLPPLAEQKAIAAVLGALDDKIELNRRMNATLEAMARALFQSWFVDFDPVRAKLDGRPAAALDPATAALFPAAFQETSLGPIPHGWEVCPLSEKIQLLSGGTPKTSEPTYWDGDIPWYSVRDAPSETDVWVINTDKHVTKLGIANSAAQIFPEKTTIISARGTVGKLALTAVPMAMNQSCYGVRGITGYGDYFTYYSLREATAQLQQRTHGTVFDTITTETFKTLDCIFPTPKITAAFDKLVEPLLGQIRANLHQSRTLATLRDTLLPKLLSGELSVTKLEN